MAFQRETKRLLTGSTNLTARGDLIPEADSSIIQDFAYDEEGNLRTRQGSTVVGIGSGRIDQLLKANGLLYAAAGGNLDRGLGNPVGPAGGPQSLAAGKGYVWDIFPGKKDNGTNFWNWAIQPPTQKPTVKADDAPSTLLSNFASTWVVDPSEAGTAFAAGGPGGTYLQIGMTAGNAYSATLSAAPFDLSQFHPQDLHRIWVWFKNAQNVGSVTVQVDVNDGTFLIDYYTVTIQVGNFKPRSKEWQQFPIRFSQNVLDPTDTTPFYTRVGTTQGKDWKTVAGLRVLISCINDTRIRLANWDVIGQADELPEGGAVRWYYTFVNDDGHESNPSPVSDPITLTRQAGLLSDIQSSPDPQVTGINVYRTWDTAQAIYRVNPTKLPIANYRDDNGNAKVAFLGIFLENDNDQPPAGATGVAGPYLGRLLAWRGGRMFWTKLDRFWAFRNPDGPDGAWVDIGNTDDFIQNIIIHPNSAWIYKQRSIWILVGDPENSPEADLAFGAFGIPNPNAVYPGVGGDFIIGLDGEFFFNGSSCTKLSDKLDPIFKGRAFTSTGGFVVSALDKANAAIGYNGDQVLSCYGAGSAALNLRNGNWLLDSRQFTSFYFDGVFLGGQIDGKVRQIGTADPDSLSLWFEKSFDAGLPDSDKNFEDFTIQSDGGLSVTAILNFAGGAGLGVAAAGRSILPFASGFGDRARNCTIVLTGSSFTEVFGMWLNFWIHAREADSFDTSPTSFGSPELKRVRELKIDIENTASALLTVQTDNPGAAFATRESDILAASSRRLLNIVLAADYAGYLHRYVLFGADLRVYEMWALVQQIGTFLQGSRGEFYSSDAVDMDTERVKLAHEIEIVYASDASATLTLETDLPDGFLTVKETYDLPSTGASVFTINEERTEKLRVHSEVKGRLHRIKVHPLGDMRIESIREEIKVVGAPGASGWTWYSYPVKQTNDGVWTPVPIPVDIPA